MDPAFTTPLDPRIESKLLTDPSHQCGWFSSNKQTAVNAALLSTLILVFSDTSPYAVLALVLLLGILCFMQSVSGHIESFLVQRDAFVEVLESSPIPGIVVDFSSKTPSRYMPNKEYAIKVKCPHSLYVKCLYWEKDTFYFAFKQNKHEVSEEPHTHERKEEEKKSNSACSTKEESKQSKDSEEAKVRARSLT